MGTRPVRRTRRSSGNFWSCCDTNIEWDHTNPPKSELNLWSLQWSSFFFLCVSFCLTWDQYKGVDQPTSKVKSHNWYQCSFILYFKSYKTFDLVPLCLTVKPLPWLHTNCFSLTGFYSKSPFVWGHEISQMVLLNGA